MSARAQMTPDTIRLALKIISGRLHPASLSITQVEMLGFDERFMPNTDNDILEQAENIVFMALDFAIRKDA